MLPDPGIPLGSASDGGNTLLHRVAGDRGFRLQILSDRLDPQELVRVARSLG